MLVRLPLYLAGLIVSLAILANALSRAVTSLSPETALFFNPFNTDATIALVSHQLTSTGTADGESIDPAIDSAIAISPADARLYSLSGIVQQMRGDEEQAQESFEHALQLSPTEIQALLHTFVFSLKKNDMPKAADLTDLISRRWPDYWERIAPFLPVMAASDSGREALAERFSENRLGRLRLINSLISTPETIELARAMVTDWRRAGIADLHIEINQVTRALYNNNEPELAYQFNFLMLNDAARREAGYVFNGSFNREPRGNIFDWTIPQQTGIEINQHLVDETSSDDLTNYLALRFLGNPVRLRNVRQRLQLPPGSYQMSVLYEARELATPKPIRFSVFCEFGRKQIAAVEINPAADKPTKGKAEFSVPTENCTKIYLELNSEFVALSWRNRFSGTVRLYDVAITRL